MDICEEGHDPIVYEDRECPVCALVVILTEAQAEVEEAVREKDGILGEIKTKFEEARTSGMSVSELYLERKIEEMTADSKLENIKWD